MKYLLFLAVIFFGFTYDSEKIILKVTVTNINTLKGNIEMGVFNNDESFPEKGQEFRTYSKSVNNDTVVFVLKDLTKGDYAIAIFHDINSDNECNLNFIGMPTEPYGFSRNFKPKFSKPSFDDCKIRVHKNESIRIELID